MRTIFNTAICFALSLHLSEHEHVLKLEHAHKTDWLNVVDDANSGHYKDVGIVTLQNKGPTAVKDHSALLEIGVHHTKNLVPDAYHEDLKRHHTAMLQAHAERKEQGATTTATTTGATEPFGYHVVKENLPAELKQNETMLHMYENAPLGVVTTRNIANSQFMGMITVGTPPVKEQVVFDTGSTNCWLTAKGCTSGACPHIDEKYDPEMSTTANPAHWVPAPSDNPEAAQAAMIEKEREEKETEEDVESHKRPLFSIPSMPDFAKHGPARFDREERDRMQERHLMERDRSLKDLLNFKMPSAFIEMREEEGSYVKTDKVRGGGMRDSAIQGADADMDAVTDLFHYRKKANTTNGFAEGVSDVEGWPELFKSYYLHIRFGTGEIIGWTQKDTIRFGPVEVKQQLFGMIKEEKGSIFVALQQFAGIMGLGLPNMAAQGSVPVMDSAMAQGLPGVFAFFMETRSDWPSAFMFGGVLKETLASNLHLVEVYQPHYWSMRLLRIMVGDEEMDTTGTGSGPIKSLVVDSGTSSMTADSQILPDLLVKLGAQVECSDIGGNEAQGIAAMKDFTFVVAVNGGQEEPADGFIEYDIVLTPQQYMLHSAGSTECSPAWWAIDVPPPFGPAFLLGELFLKHFMTIFRRERTDPLSGEQLAPAVMAIATAQKASTLEQGTFYDQLIAGAGDEDSKQLFTEALNDKREQDRLDSAAR